MENIYFTSDLHIAHNKEFIWKARGYSSIEEHDSEILSTWNSIVQPEDTVYILGDLCMGGDKEEWDRIYKALNGKIKFIRGNHDTNNKIDRYIKEYKMEDLGLATMFKISKKRRFLLSHYPTLVSNYKEPHFFWNLSGHQHSTDPFENGKGCVYNVAWDAHKKPISLDEIVKQIEHYRQTVFQGE